MDEIDVANDYAAQFADLALKAALARTPSRPSSGICDCCHADIEPQRLRINPAAQLCRDCAEESEAARVRAKRTGSRR